MAKAPIFSIKWNHQSVELSFHHEIPALKYKDGWITGTRIYSGFSLASGLPKAKLVCASPGSIYRYDFEKELDDAFMDRLVGLSLLGLQPLNHSGLNLFMVM